jgi:hypothetical protein
MLKFFRTSSRYLQRHVQELTDDLHELRGDLTNRLQQVEQGCVRIWLERMLCGIHEAAELAIRRGLPAALAIGKGLRAVVAPLPPAKRAASLALETPGAIRMGRSCPKLKSLRLIDKRTNDTRLVAGCAPPGRSVRPRALSCRLDFGLNVGHDIRHEYAKYCPSGTGLPLL